MKRVISLLLACVMLASLLSTVTIRAEAATIYNPDAAIAYAAAHATDTPEIAGADCANFVSKCVTAGGIPVSEIVCHNLMLALKPYASVITNLEIEISNGYGRVPTSGTNASILSKGDVMFVCCERCKQTGNNYERHAVMYSGDSDSNGYARCYAHTSMANNTTFWVGYDGSYACSNGHATSYLAAEVIHFAQDDAPKKPTITTTTAYYAEGSDITISWNAVSGNTYYWVNLYKDGNLIVDKSMGNETTFTHKNAAKGEYKFVVSANNSIGTSGGSQYSFLVGMKPEKPEASIAKTFYTSGETVTVNWEPVLGNTYYWVSAYRDGKLIKNQTAGNSTTFTMQVDSKGMYEIQVSANNGAGTSGSSKCLFLVDMAPEKPQILNEKQRYDAGDSVVVEWSAVVGNIYYWINVYQEDELIVNQTAGNQTSYTISSVHEGVYKVYVSANNSAGTSGSDLYEFVVGNPKYIITYDANGGMNAPKSQTKVHGEALVLSNSIPTRSGYTFQGWATDSKATTAEYQPGGSFTTDADTTLYAVWTAHNYTYKVTTKPTTDATGTLTGTCTNCGGTTTVTLPKLNTTDYTYKVIREATCTADGTGRYTWKTTTYGTFYFDVAISKTGHSFGNWSVTKQPTCTEKGQEKRTCTTCGHAETRDVAAKGHDWTAANCTDPRVCKTCGAADGKALGHSFGDWSVTKQPTCTEKGQEKRTCATCGHAETRDVAAKGHDWKDATCTKPKTCTTCGTTEGEALGHSFGEWTEINAGERERVCSVCGYTEKESVSSECPSAVFTDIAKDAWYHEAVDYAVANGLMNGVGDGKFEPQGQLTRAQLVTILYRLKGAPSVKGLTNPFTDVPAGQWYTNAIIWAAEEGVVRGITETTFSPNAAITREQIATILYRYTGAENIEEDHLKSFTDASSLSEYALQAMNWAVECGLINGMGDGTLSPRGTATRAQIATVLMRYCKFFQ